MASTALHILEDSGVPNASTNYTTLVVIHGYTWHSGIFSKFVPLAKDCNTRVILVNRRDYPGARPFTQEERALLPSLPTEEAASATEIAEATQKIDVFMKERAREVYDLLIELVKNEDLPPFQRERNTGGIIVAGWSFGTVWITALLAHSASFATNSVDLSAYMRRVIFFDPSYHLLGYLPPETSGYHPLLDPELTPETIDHVFARWVSGYYGHGDSLETLEQKTPVQDPPPTIAALTPEEVVRAQYLPPGASGGSDALLFQSGRRLGLFKTLKERALYLPSPGAPSVTAGNTWPEVEVCFTWCLRSTWDTTWGAWALRKELEDAEQKGVAIRRVRMMRIRGANHFVSWDQPEKAFRALVGDEDDVQ
ncbi:uncharacterized protein TRAVEDRAFT_135327 [Trametes versicolor FP-101664 SS1]|uniref:uncharacterized protein n=1 Tax=Trametes versicolor (strain FP-101664) TaxID=717944 RepID=UPI0004623A94|nr:uncharacterized protein TRAVEDRAFT_135327 [Trametes versicolor FP-101664 SS1]EIW52719.1 hypothetical protein TRAVEDRAFT_135327 [Trametes versicolor FP-101664 SS1]